VTKHAHAETKTYPQHRLLDLTEREHLLATGGRVVVGVSGGPDSLCLLHLLWSHRDQLGVQIYAAHLNHLLRGADADADARFVGQLAADWGIPCTVDARDVRAFATERRLAIEEAARQLRYAFLAQVAWAVGATHIAVAHNADDQTETVLMHWLRGAGLAGLRGMLPATRLSDLHIAGLDTRLEGTEHDKDLWLIRPLLDTPRTEIERYCQQHNLSPRYDRSNLDTTYYRNKLRHELLPYLEREYKPGLAEILRRSARVIRDDYDLLCFMRDQAWDEVVQQASARAVVLDRPAWRALHPALQRATLRQAARHLRHSLRDVNYVHVQAAVEVATLGQTGDRATLPGGIQLVVGYDTLTIADRGHKAAPDFPALPTPVNGAIERFPLQVPGTTSLPVQIAAQIEVVPRTALAPGWQRNDDPWCAYLDASVLGQELYLRRRRPGDRFRPLGMRGQSKLVSDLLVNDKVPSAWRDRIPLLVRADDSILWVCGQRIDERARITESTSQVAIVRLTIEE
jgi:tRNA(Ile)-lysidine synthase